MEITQELLETIYTRANQYCLARYGKVADRVIINELGDIEAMWYPRCFNGDEEYETITADKLTADLDEVAKEREAENARIREFEKQRQINLQLQRDAEKLVRDRAEYLRLKKQFEP